MADTKGSRKAKGDGSGKIAIKKYANRRLYNTAKSGYVTLDDLAKMVRDGEDFAVYDAKTGEDITRSVLTQIIVEEEAKTQNMLPTNFLRELIRLYGDPMQSLVPSYLDAAMQSFIGNQEKIRQSFASGSPMGGLENIARANMELFEKSMRMFSPFGQSGAANPAGRPEPEVKKAPEPETPADATDLESLQEQLRQMQEQLSALSKKDG